MNKVATQKQKMVAPNNREIITSVIAAACQFYEVTQEELITERKMATARQLCFFIIKKSTFGLYPTDIALFFNKKRTAVEYGIDLIDSHKGIYRQTLDDLNCIVNIANTFEKKYQWHLQQINTTR